jgi:hypothetical protein
MIVTYAALLNENGIGFEAWEFPDKTITVYGTGTVTVEGSPDGTNGWVGLKDQAGAAISLVVAASGAAALILENPKYMRVVNNNATGVLAVITCSK